MPNNTPKNKKSGAEIAKKIALKLLPPLAFILIFCLLCGWIYTILMKNEKFASLMVSVDYAIDVIINGVEEEPDTLTRAQPTDYEIVLPYGVSSTSSFAFTLDDGTLPLPETETEEGETADTTEEEDAVEEYDGADGYTMYVVFNGIANRETDYFYAPTGTLTLTAKATGESTGMKSFKIALWEKLPGETTYVESTTIYFYTNDETNTYTITGLDPDKEYRMNFSYDAYGYYIYGVMQVDGVSFDAPVSEEEVLTEEEAA
ncbi:MAG: hypothetical protein R3Y06_04160 [Faecalibacterium sp.]